MYDIEKGHALSTIGGPYVSSDSIDVCDDMVLVGSYRNNKCLQLFSASQMKLIFTVEFNSNGGTNTEHGYLFGTCFDKDANFIYAGGAGKNELKAF